MPAPVRLNIYDLSSHGAARTANSVLSAVGTGAFHAAVEVYGTEWSFGSGAGAFHGSGIFNCEPGKNSAHAFSESISMGQTLLTKEEVLQLLVILTPGWSAQHYHLLRQNCCHFSDMLCKRLGVGPIPARVVNLAGAGAVLEDGFNHVADVAIGLQRVTSGLVDEGKLARGASKAEDYSFGDLTRGLIAKSSEALCDILVAGKVARGARVDAEYRFGDFSSGIFRKCTSTNVPAPL